MDEVAPLGLDGFLLCQILQTVPLLTDRLIEEFFRIAALDDENLVVP
jgi:hypothetical protein